MWGSGPPHERNSEGGKNTANKGGKQEDKKKLQQMRNHIDGVSPGEKELMGEGEVCQVGK